MSTSRVGRFCEQGFVVLRDEIDPGPISEEVGRVFLDDFRPGHAARTLAQGSGTVTFQYLPMMCERTAVSLALLDRFSAIAAELMGRAVLPGRAKGTRYFGDTAWHRDSDHAIASLGCVAYLESVEETSGALRVLVGSHTDHTMKVPDLRSGDAATLCGEVIETMPGDVIIFDEHLLHGSTGGGERRQWRVDFVIDPRDDDEFTSVGAWFGQSIPDEQHDPGYDAERYPSYGPYWQTRDRPWTNRLADLGVYQRAAGHTGN
jgi:hypothetical protein